jgi:hypothetical protein
MFGRKQAEALAAVVASAETRDYVGSDGMSKPHTSLRDTTAIENARAAGATDAQILAAVDRKASRRD